MERGKLFKLTAFAPAILLVGPFLAYHAGAFEKSTPPAPQPEPQSEPDPVAATQPAPELPSHWLRFPPPERPATSDPNPNQQFMYSSKSAPAVDPKLLSGVLQPDGATVQLPQPNPNQPPTFMGGSKSIVLVPTPPPPANSPPVFMGGSKFKSVIGPNDLPKQPPPSAQAVPPQASNPPKP